MARSRRSWGAVRKLPSGRYQARYLDPETREMTAAPGTFSSKTAADRWLGRKRVELDAGTAVNERTGSQPLSEWWPSYWRSVHSHKPRTKIGYETAWRLRVEPRFGSMPVRRIKPAHVDDWTAELIEQGVSASKVIESVGVLKRVLDRAVRDKAIPVNPCDQRSNTLPKRPKTDRPVLIPTEVEWLAAAMPSEADRVLVRLLAYGGLRIGEAFALRWTDVDLTRQTMTIRESVEDTAGKVTVGPTKTYAARTITLPDPMVEQLGQVKTAPIKSGTDSLLVFPNRQGGYRRYRNWRRTWDKACERSGVTALPHDLRATCASLLIDAGASPKDVQAHLGHEDITTTMQLYARVRPGRSADIAARLGALIAEAG
jgi:integrase